MWRRSYKKQKKGGITVKKKFVLDTNILLGSNGPQAIFGFEDNDVIITGTTLQELDRKKSELGEVGYHARRACHILETLRKQGSLISGVALEGGGRCFVEPDGIDKGLLPSGYSLERADNRIISACLYIARQHPSEKVILVTNDVSMRVNASICGVEVENYRNDHISAAEEYKGRSERDVPREVIDALYRDKRIDADAVLCDPAPVENEYLVLRSDRASALAMFREGEIRLLENADRKVFSVSPMNVAQKFALHALTSDDIPLTILKGSAGTAKTFLSLAAALSKTYGRETYDHILISRNNVTSDEGFGFLPGDIEDKMGPLLGSFTDNLEALLRGNSNEDPDQIKLQIEDMYETGVIKVFPLAYMRGRSITNSYVIVDEVQNATRSQIRDIITRCGRNCHMVLCGDPNQVDNHLLDKWNNGLVYASDKMKGSPLCAQITFTEEESVRSPLAKDALKRMDF